MSLDLARSTIRYETVANSPRRHFAGVLEISRCLMSGEDNRQRLILPEREKGLMNYKHIAVLGSW
jgi:hypothetical protein